MSNKKRQIIAWAINAGILVLLIVWLICSLNVKCKFIEVGLAEWLSITLGFEAVFIISYYFTIKKQDYEKKIETYESIIIKMQKILAEDPAHINSLNMNEANIKAKEKFEFFKNNILSYFRELNNCFDLLNKYKGDLDISEDLDFIKKHVDDYKEKVTDDGYYDNQTIKQVRSYIRRQVGLIDNKLDEIRLKLH